MSRFFLAALMVIGMASASQAAVILSTSATDANAGTSLELQVGQTGSIYTWISTNAGQTFTGVGIDILSSAADVLEATAHNINNPGNRWLNVAAGDLGDLVTGSNAIALVGFAGDGLSTSGQDDFTLHSEIVFTATAIGQTQLTITPNNNGIGDLTGDVTGSVTFGSGAVNVTAVPEPSSLCLLGGLFGLGVLRRKRRA